jgi:hypothetical protein
MPNQPYRGLRILLTILSVLLACASLVMIFAGRPLLLRLFLYPPESEFSILLFAVLKELGGFAITISALCYFASRDPLRNVAIIDALIIGLCVLAFTGPLAFYSINLGSIYPSYLVWGRSIARLALAALLVYLRPRESTPARS